MTTTPPPPLEWRRFGLLLQHTSHPTECREVRILAQSISMRSLPWHHNHNNVHETSQNHGRPNDSHHDNNNPQWQVHIQMDRMTPKAARLLAPALANNPFDWISLQQVVPPHRHVDDDNEDILLETMDIFLHALNRNASIDKVQLSLDGIRMRLDTLAQFLLRNRACTRLELRNVVFCHVDASRFKSLEAACLQSNNVVKKLVLGSRGAARGTWRHRQEQQQEPQDASPWAVTTLLARQLCHNLHLVNVPVSFCLTALYHSQVTRLTLETCRFDTQDWLDLARGLAQCETLEQVAFESCEWTKSGSETTTTAILADPASQLTIPTTNMPGTPTTMTRKCSIESIAFTNSVFADAVSMDHVLDSILWKQKAIRKSVQSLTLTTTQQHPNHFLLTLTQAHNLGRLLCDMSSSSSSSSLCKVKLGGTFSWKAFFQPLLFKHGDSLHGIGNPRLEELEIVTPSPPRHEDNALLTAHEDWRSLSQFVEASTALRQLTISTPKPNDEKLTMLLQALRDNTSLQECSLRLDGMPVRQEELAFFCWRNRLQARLAKVPVAPERILSHSLHKALHEETSTFDSRSGVFFLLSSYSHCLHEDSRGGTLLTRKRPRAW